MPWALPLLSHPPGAVLEQRRQFKFDLELQRLRRGVRLNTEVNFKQAKSAFLLRNERRRGMKRIYHVMQMLEWARQIATDGKVTLRAACNHHYYAMMRSVEASMGKDVKSAWDEFCLVWRPIYEEIDRQFEKSTTIYAQFEKSWEAARETKDRPLRLPSGVLLSTKELCSLEFIHKYGVQVRTVVPPALQQLTNLICSRSSESYQLQLPHPRGITTSSC